MTGRCEQDRGASYTLCQPNNCTGLDLSHSAQRHSYILGQARLLGKISQHDCRSRVLLRGLQHKGVASCDCHRKHPQGNHGWEVEGADPRTHLCMVTHLLNHTADAEHACTPSCVLEQPRQLGQAGWLSCCNSYVHKQRCVYKHARERH